MAAAQYYSHQLEILLYFKKLAKLVIFFLMKLSNVEKRHNSSKWQNRVRLSKFHFLIENNQKELNCLTNLLILLIKVFFIV